ncbi:MAG: ABC transporter substrate-binding protein [Janthinobacterium lividum]
MNPLARRTLLRGAALSAMGLPLAAMAPVVLRSRTTTFDPLATELLANSQICRVADERAFNAVASGAVPRKLKLAWNANAICTVGVPVAARRGIFKQHGLDVEPINFGGSTDELLEAIATGKADAGVGMALRWLKPLEQGFDVRITTAIHGGCIRLFAQKGAGIAAIADLKGKTIGCSDLAAPDKNFFSIVAAKQGIDPNTDIEWRAYPADLLGVALKKGEIQAVSLGDPLGWILRERDDLLEIANNLQGEYAQRACCVLGVRGSLIKEDRPAAAALTASLLEAQEWVAMNPDAAAAIFAPYSPAKPEQLAAMLRSHTHHHHPAGAALTAEIALYAQELKEVQVLKPRTDPRRFAERVTADVLA